MPEILIQHGRVIDPSRKIDRVADLLLRDGKVVGVDQPGSDRATVIDAADKIVAPGLIDMYVEFREPGWEEDETIRSGSAAALAGGFATVACIPNTEPPIDSQAGVEFVQHQAAIAANCNVVVLACVSKNREGRELAELGTLHAAGARGFTDADRPIHNAELMRRALEYARMFDRPILNHPEVLELNKHGVMHEGLVSTRLGLSGMPAVAEDVMTSRDVGLAESTGGRLHLLNISSGGSVEIIRRAKNRGVPITAGITACHFALTDEALLTFDANAKANPPLRSAHHVQQCISALVDDTLDVICSGHAPRASEKKMLELDKAPFGINALETTLGLVCTYLIEPGHLTWSKAIEKLTTKPAEILRLKTKGGLSEGCDADVTIIDPRRRWRVEPGEFYSSSQNTPLKGAELAGRADMVIVGGRIKFDRWGVAAEPTAMA